MTIDIEELNAALESFTRSAEYAVASLGKTFHTVKEEYLCTWQWINVMHKRSVDDMACSNKYAEDEVSLRCVQRALQGRFPPLQLQLFHIDELGITDGPEHLLAICISKECLPDPGQYT